MLRLLREFQHAPQTSSDLHVLGSLISWVNLAADDEAGEGGRVKQDVLELRTKTCQMRDKRSAKGGIE